MTLLEEFTNVQSRSIDFSRFDPTKIHFSLFGKPPVTNTKEFMKLLLLDFYGRSSMADKEVRRAWCSSIFWQNDSVPFEKFAEILYAKVSNLGNLCQKNSWPELPLGFNLINLTENNLAIALYFRSMVFDCESLINIPPDDTILLGDYSFAVTMGEICFAYTLIVHLIVAME